jgi:hypothetical protein
MSFPGMNSLHRSGSVGSISPVKVEDASTARQTPVIEARVSNQPVASGSQLRSAPLEPKSAKAEGELREAAGALAAKFKNAEVNRVEVYTELLALQGKLLQAQPDVLYEDLASHLHEGLSSVHDEEQLALVESRQRASAAIETLGAQKGSELQTRDIVDALVQHDQATLQSLEIRHSRYEEALNSPGLSPETKRDIERSRQTFIDHAVHLGSNTSRRIDECVSASQRRLDELDEQLKDVSAQPSGSAPRTEGEIAELQQARAHMASAHQAMVAIKEAYKPPEQMKAALANVKLPQILAKYEQQRSYMNIFRAATPAALAQLIASSLHFGATRGSIETALADQSFARRVGTAGVGLGVAHELVNNTVRPASQEIMGSLGAKGVRPVNVNEVIPNPVRTYTRDGVVHTRTEQQMIEVQANIDKLRTTFIEAQNNHKFGTIKGELTGYGSFGAAQLVLEALVDAGVLPKKSVPALMLASASGGFLMALLQTLNQLTTTVEDEQGRKLPTHVPKDVAGKLTDRLAKVGSDALKSVDLRDRKVLEAFLSKIAGSIQGIGISTAVSDNVKHLSNDTAGHIASKLLVSSFGPTLTLSSFFAAMQTQPEATKGGTGRLGNVGNNLVAPGRDTLPHTTAAGTKSRAVEDTVHRVRGGLQAPSQAAVVATSAGVRGAVKGAQKLGDLMKGPSPDTRQGDLEMDRMERGLAS